MNDWLKTGLVNSCLKAFYVTAFADIFLTKKVWEKEMLKLVRL